MNVVGLVMLGTTERLYLLTTITPIVYMIPTAAYKAKLLEGYRVM